MSGFNGLQVVAAVVSVVLLPGALVRLWRWALRPDERFDHAMGALGRSVKRVNNGGAK